MPRRAQPHPLGLMIGARIRQLRLDAGVTLEKLAYESDVGSKGFVSDVERGLALPTLQTLQRIAERLDVEVFDLLVCPGKDARHDLVDATRGATPNLLRRARELFPTDGRRPPVGRR